MSRQKNLSAVWFFLSWRQLLDQVGTGSGGRDLSGNKRTNKEQGFDQEFTALNKALQLSCTKGYPPVRVVRSYKDKHSQYARPG